MMTTQDPFSLQGGETEVVKEVQKPSEPAATEKQVKFLRSLLEDRDIEKLNGNLYERAFDIATDAEKFVGKHEASKLIDTLLTMPKVRGPVQGDPPEGIHIVPAFKGGKDAVYKVQVAHQGSGRKYAKRLNVDTGEFEYVGRDPLKNLSEETLMTLEQARTFGHLYGWCVRCGATLTDENSIAAGIGPVCATRF